MTKRFVVFVVHPVKQIRHPTDAGFGDHDLEFPMRIKRATENYLTERLVELHRHRRDERGELAPAGVAYPGAPDAAAQMKAYRDTGFGCHRPQRLPIFMEHRFYRVENTKKGAPQPAEFGDPLEFVDRGCGVVHWQHRNPEQPFRRGGAKLRHPGIVRFQAYDPKLGILEGEG